MYVSSDISIVSSIPDNKINDLQPSIQKIRKEKGNKEKFDQDAFKLSESEKKTIQKLKERDREVRIHEQQHKTVAGQYAEGMSFSYQTGPDGSQYAIGGQVQLDTSPIPDDPEATIEKMKQIKRAALAPSKPSAKDRQVAAESDHEIVRQYVEVEKDKNDKNDKAEQAYSQTNDQKRNSVNIYS